MVRFRIVDDRDGSLPPYETLDGILHAHIDGGRFAGGDRGGAGLRPGHGGPGGVRVDRNEYTRQQLATGLKVSAKAFGSGRRMPIAAKYHSN